MYLSVQLFSITQLAGSNTQLCPIGVMQTLPAILGKQKQLHSKSSVGDDTIDATNGTIFEVVQASDLHTPSVSAPVVVRNSVLGVAQLEALGSLHPPFRINIAGVVAEIGDSQPTVGGSGKPMRTLLISDAKGCYVTVRQLGGGVEDTEIRLGSMVVAYFLHGRKAWRTGESGSLWAYEDSVIKVLSNSVSSMPTLGKEVHMLAE